MDNTGVAGIYATKAEARKVAKMLMKVGKLTRAKSELVVVTRYIIVRK